ncbi:MAG: hypothetical protein NVSMB27_34920 [Ktedonobacteraceae bacterium]
MFVGVVCSRQVIYLANHIVVAHGLMVTWFYGLRQAVQIQHPMKSVEERSEEDGEGKECNFYIDLSTTSIQLERNPKYMV